MSQSIDITAIENLVFEGGGIRSIAAIGAIQYMEEHNLMLNVRRFCGSSGGSILASALAVGWTGKELETVISSSDLTQFADEAGTFWRSLKRLWRQITKRNLPWDRFKYKYGLYDGWAFQNWFETQILLPKTGSRNTTFAELFKTRGIVLVIPGACVNERRLHLYHYQTNPNMRISDAVRISMSLPYLFKAVVWGKDVLVDSGTFNNYPLYIFDDSAASGEDHLPDTRKEKYEDSRAFTCDANYRTLGLKLLDSEEKVLGLYSGKVTIKNLGQFSAEIVNAMLLEIERMQIDSTYWVRTVPIQTGNVQTTDFNIDYMGIKQLIAAGFKAMAEFHASKV